MAFLFSSDEKLEKHAVYERLKETLDMLRDVNARMADIQERIDAIEKVLSERLPPDILTEHKFREEVQSGDEIVGKIISKVEDFSKAKSIRDLLEERIEQEQRPSIVETRRIEAITGFLQQHGKLNSEDLAKHTGLSRTRCNEYFKQMEEMGIVEPVLVGREKFYRLS